MGFQQRFIEEENADGNEHHYRRHRHRHRTTGVTGTMRAQVLRSSAKWSSGIELEVILNTIL
jgi:phospholipase D1/2